MAIWCGPDHARFEVSFDVYRGFGRNRRRDTPSTRRGTSYKEAGLQGEGSGRRAGVGVVVTWKQVMIRSQRCWTLRRILAC